ncbi:hypothetical protein J7S78_14140 [Klebsiella oxytoca]|uniref:Uncharacterized protein n=1 Tax=Klebsiella oxytoca TaxID=571 RepID=A0AAP2BJX7_KLEOX|nr:hypothetical protein [Klebsiella oxytoca]MBQ0600935.1 hypothetical protein [Klebsiella oxytoca]
MNTNNTRSINHKLKNLTKAFAANEEIKRELALLGDTYERDTLPLRAQLIAGAEVIKRRQTQYERELVTQWGGLIDPEGDIRFAPFLPGFSPDFSMLFNPPYPGFCEGMLTGFIREHYLTRRQRGEEKNVEIGLRYPPTKDTLPLMLKGITTLLPYMTKMENGHVKVTANTSITFPVREGNAAYIGYKSLVIDPESGRTDLLIHVSGEEEAGLLSFDVVRSALLHLVSSRYFTANRCRKLLA